MTVSTTALKNIPGSTAFARLLACERLIAGGVAIVFLGFLLFFALRWFEHSVTFHPLRFDDRTGWLQPTGAQDVWLKAADGVRLHGWLFETRERPSLATVIFFHGNGGNIANVGWVGESLSSRGFDVLLMDHSYRARTTPFRGCKRTEETTHLSGSRT